MVDSITTITRQTFSHLWVCEYFMCIPGVPVSGKIYSRPARQSIINEIGLELFITIGNKEAWQVVNWSWRRKLKSRLNLVSRFEQKIDITGALSMIKHQLRNIV